MTTTGGTVPLPVMPALRPGSGQAPAGIQGFLFLHCGARLTSLGARLPRLYDLNPTLERRVEAHGVTNFLPLAFDCHACVFRKPSPPIIIEVEISPASGSLSAASLTFTRTLNFPAWGLNSIRTFSSASGSPDEPPVLSLKTHRGPLLVFQPAPGGMLRQVISPSVSMRLMVTPSAGGLMLFAAPAKVP